MNIFRKLGEKSWATPGAVSDVDVQIADPETTAKKGLLLFLSVLTSMFFLFIVTYRLRMDLSDWVPLKEPTLLWVNTALLIAASLAMQRAKTEANRGLIKQLRIWLTVAGGLSIAFIGGQIIAWQELVATGAYSRVHPAFTFFVLLTALHALHLFGGLVAWAMSTYKAWSGMEIIRFKLSIELCTTYWHYLLLVWLIFFALLLLT